MQCCSEQIEPKTHIGLRIRGMLSRRYCSPASRYRYDAGFDDDDLDCFGAKGLSGTQSAGTSLDALTLPQSGTDQSGTSQSGAGLVSSPGGSLPTFNSDGNSFASSAPARDAFGSQAPDPQAPTTITTTPGPAPISNVAFNSLSGDATSPVPDTRSDFDKNSNAVVSANHFDNMGRPLGPQGPSPGSSGIIAGINPQNGLPQLGNDFGDVSVSVSPLKSIKNVVENPGTAFSNGWMFRVGANIPR